MERLRRQQLLEQGIYGSIWIVLLLLPLIGGLGSSGGEDKRIINPFVCATWMNFLPFFVLFVVNNYLLVPCFFFKKRYGQYILSLFLTATIILAVASLFIRNYSFKELWQPSRSLTEWRELPGEGVEQSVKDTALWQLPPSSAAGETLGSMNRPPQRAPFPHPPLSIRYLVYFLIAFLVAGFNIAIKLLFKSFQDEDLLKEMEHEHLQSELQYLKYQINPHFFMNTLNNIHALVDIDTEKAKSTIVELSRLMRYVLYEASRKTILLSREIRFLENYVGLMSIRCTDNVAIEMKFPSEIPEVQIPPLLFISFVENAFKHGVSSRNESFIHISMQIEEGNNLSFRCVNSNYDSTDEQHHGIGLENISKRLQLLYGNNYTLSITNEGNRFEILLIIPLLQ